MILARRPNHKQLLILSAACALAGCGASENKNNLEQAAPPAAKPAPVCATDWFQPKTLTKKLDVLFVLDPSSAEAIGATSGSFAPLLRSLPNEADVRFAVLLGTHAQHAGALYSAPGLPKVLDGQKLSAEQIAGDLQKTFAAASRYAQWQDSGESLFYSLQQASTTRALEIQKRGFFRPDAALGVIFLSDQAEAGSPFPDAALPYCREAHHEAVRKAFYAPRGIDASSTLGALRSLKGDMPILANALVNLSAQEAQIDEQESCLSTSPGYGYFEIVKRTQGVLHSLQQSRETGMEQIGRALRGRLEQRQDFRLSQPAAKVDPASLVVTVNGERPSFEYRADLSEVHLLQAPSASVEIQHCEPTAVFEKSITAFSGETTPTTALLHWDTPRPAKGKLRYGTSVDSLNNVLEDSSPSTSHDLTVTNLKPHTTYFFQVTAEEFGPEERSSLLSLETKPDWRVSLLRGEASRTYASLRWNTEAYPTTGFLRWGTSPDQLINTLPVPGASEHTMNVAGLLPETVYYFQAVARDEYGLEQASSVLSLRTPSEWALLDFRGETSRTSARFAWQTPGTVTEGELRYGLSPEELNSVLSAPASSHSVALGHLEPGTTYFFQAVARDSAGVERKSPVIALRTLEDWSLANLDISTTDSSASLRFTTAGFPTSGKIYWGTSPDSLSSFVATSASDQTHEVSVTGLLPDTIYYFQAVAIDRLGEERSSEVIPVRTQASLGPKESILALSGWATRDSVTVAGERFGTLLWGENPGELRPAEIPADHAGSTLRIAGLRPDTTYYFQAFSRSGDGPRQASPVIAVRTQSLPPPTWAITGFTGISTASEVALTWETAAYATKSQLLSGLTPQSLRPRGIEASADTKHAFTVGDLEPDTIYFFQLISEDDLGQRKASPVIAVRTEAQPLRTIAGGANP